MLAQSRYVNDFFVAGFRMYDGALVLNKMRPGDVITLIPQFDCPHDENAIALKYDESMLGYIPADDNTLPAQLLRFGHTDVLECRILQINPEADPWKQVRVGLYVTDKRTH